MAKTLGQGKVRTPARLRKPGRKEQVAHRQQQAVALRVAGGTLEQIGRQLGVSAMQVHRDIARAMGIVVARRERDAERLVALELERLDAVTRAMVPRANEGNSKAAAVLVRASESRRKLLGLDAAQRVELSGRGGLPITVAHEHRPYEHLTDAELLARLEGTREQLRQAIEAEAAPAATPEPEPDDLEARYARTLAARRQTH